MGKAIQQRRKQLGMSAEDLSGACSQLGLEIARPVLSNLENGRREGIPVHQLVVIAAALRVPPLALLFPERAELIEHMPGQVLSWDACMTLFTGDKQIVRQPTDDEFEALGAAMAKAMQREMSEQRQRRLLAG